MRLVSCVLIVSVLSTGCFAYAPVPAGVPDRRDRVRIHLSEPTSFTVGPATYHMIGEVEGEVIRWTEDQLALSATWLTSVAGQEFGGNMHTILVPRDRISLVEKRRLSPWRTAAIFGAGAFLSAAVSWAIPGIWSSGDGSGGSGGSAK
ncbi:MAG TPA: hypothetical protein VF212_04875 [Longimicrobiales bacterium]